MKSENKTELRIREVMGGNTSMQYHDLMEKVFPPEQYPKAYERSVNGGPPGCAMTFGAAIRRMGGRSYGMGSERMVAFDNRQAWLEVVEIDNYSSKD